MRRRRSRGKDDRSQRQATDHHRRTSQCNHPRPKAHQTLPFQARDAFGEVPKIISGYPEIDARPPFQRGSPDVLLCKLRPGTFVNGLKWRVLALLFIWVGLNRVVSRDNSQFSSYRRALTLAISLSVREDCVGWGGPGVTGVVLIQRQRAGCSRLGRALAHRGQGLMGLPLGRRLEVGGCRKKDRVGTQLTASEPGFTLLLWS